MAPDYAKRIKPGLLQTTKATPWLRNGPLRSLTGQLSA